MKKLLLAVFSIWIIVGALPLDKWQLMNAQEKSILLRTLGEKYCLEQNCSSAKIIALEVKDAVLFDALCLQKDIKGLISI